MPVAYAYTKSFIKGEKSLEMKNVFSKSTPEFDFQKFFNLILTEQRAQRVDLARIAKRIALLAESFQITELPPTEEQQEQPDDTSGSTR